jgi:hypothetical protein
VAPENITIKEGAASAKVTRVGVDCSLTQDITSYMDHIGEIFSLGVWVLATASSQARLSITDNVKTSYSVWHSGGGGWEFLETELQVSAGATGLAVSLEVMGTDGDVFFDGASGGVRKSADYLAVLGHDFHGSGGTLILEASDDGFVSEVQTVLSLRPTSNRALVSEARLLANPGFEVWDKGPNAAPTGWTLGGGPSAAIGRESIIVFDGLYSARLASAQNETAYLEADKRGNPLDLAYLSGRTISFGVYVNTSTSGRVTLRIYDDDGTGAQFTEGAAHTGGGTWQFLTVTRTLRPGLTSLSARCHISTGPATTAYLDSAVMKAVPSLQAGDLSDYITPGAVSRRHWRLKMTGHMSAPRMSICVWGDKTILDYASTAFDPYAEAVQASVNISSAGFLMGVHERYSERRMNLTFRGADAALYGKVRSWWETSGLKNFFLAWERGNNPDDVFLMYPDSSFTNPLKNTGLYRDINIKLKGRKE